MNRMMMVYATFLLLLVELAGTEFTYESDGRSGPESPHFGWMGVSSRPVVYSRKRLEKEAEA
jgi:hypothetical protein